MNVILLLILSYFLGSIPTAYILAKSLKGVDIRKVGSGNPGATNITRIAGMVIGLLVFVIDALKGFIPVIISKNFFPIEILQQYQDIYFLYFYLLMVVKVSQLFLVVF
jgi:acyl-phosphate glycerol 3-phosphate acyltransferase